MFVDLDDKELKRLEADLLKFKAKALPFATKATLNTAAFQGLREAKRRIEDQMILRNRWLLGSLRVEQSKTLKMSNQRSVLGTFSPELEAQEFGAAKRSRGRFGVTLPTTVASREGRGVRPRRRLPVGKAAVRKLQLRKGKVKAKNRRQANLIKIKQAAQSGRQEFVHLNTSRGSGFYRVKGGKRSTRVELIADTSRRAVTIPANPWLKPTIDTIRPRMPGIYRKELKKQLIRHRLFTRR